MTAPILGVNQDFLNSSILPALGETGYILARTTESNGAGNQRESWTKGTAVPCNIAPKSGGKYVGRGGGAQKSAEAERIDDLTVNVITLPAGTEVNERDRIEIEGRGLFDVLELHRRIVEIARQVDAREVIAPNEES